MKGSFLNSRKLDNFTKTCLGNTYFPKVVERANDIWNNSKTFNGFVKEFQKQFDLISTQGYFELIRKYGNIDIFKSDLIRFFKENGGKVFHTYSECGSVKIGNSDLSFNVNNGYGDGTTTVVVVENVGKKVDFCLNFVTDCEGKIGIFETDYSKDGVVYELDGWYGIYNFNGLVVFEKWG